MKMKVTEDIDERQELCNKARVLIKNWELNECEKLLCDAMGKYPHMPEPNNLLGILMEKQGDHVLAMKHFRAAWALDPTYRPARQNLESYSSFSPVETVAFDENDCLPDPLVDRFEIEYDARGVGHAVRKK
jgi:lipoprotein NlpI